MTRRRDTEMMGNDHSGGGSFELLTRLITVRDLAQPIFGQFDVSESVADVFETWNETCMDTGQNPMDGIALATEHGRPVGWFGFDMLHEGKLIRDCADPLLPNNMLSANTPVLEAAKAFDVRGAHHYFILNENRIDGWMGYGDLFKLPFRLCLFALLLGIEQLASDLAHTQPRSALAALSPGLLEGAKRTYAKRGLGLDPDGKEYDSSLLDCTTFAGKIKILRKNFKGKVPACSNRLFDTAEDMRNSLAHPRNEGQVSELLERGVLLPFLNWATEIQAQMKRVLEAGL